MYKYYLIHKFDILIYITYFTIIAYKRLYCGIMYKYTEKNNKYWGKHGENFQAELG